MSDYNVRDYMSSTFIKKEELRAGGPRRAVIQTVEETDGLPQKDGKPRKELVLVFADGTRFGLRAKANQQRLLDAFGELTSGWLGKQIEIYYSPDVPNPNGGEPGGMRIRMPETAPKAEVYASDLRAESVADLAGGRRGKARGVA